MINNWQNTGGIWEQPGVPTSGVSQVLHLSTSGGSGGDTFTITPNAAVKTLLGYSGTATAAIAYNATAASVQAALVALFSTAPIASAVVAACVVCTGGPLGTQVVITLQGALGGIPTSTWTTTDSGGVTSTITTSTTGTLATLRGATYRGQWYVDTTNHKAYENTQTTTVYLDDVCNPQWTALNGIPPIVNQ